MTRLLQKLLLTIGLFSSLGIAASAHAGLIASDYVDFGGERVFYKQYTHNVNGQPLFSRGAAESATLEITVSDDKQCNLRFCADEWIPLVLLIVVEDLDFDTGGLSIGTFSNGLEVEALAVLNKTGTLTWTIKALNDFLVHDATLNVYGQSAAVPEPGTLGLLGAGLLCLGLMQRRQKAA